MGLYKLVGETQVGEAVVASVKMESSMEWHCHLVDMSERGLLVLSHCELFL